MRYAAQIVLIKEPADHIDTARLALALHAKVVADAET
jgi:hypothetical protein